MGDKGKFNNARSRPCKEGHCSKKEKKKISTCMYISSHFSLQSSDASPFPSGDIMCF